MDTEHIQNSDMVVMFPSFHHKGTRDLIQFLGLSYSSVSFFKPYASNWNMERAFVIFKGFIRKIARHERITDYLVNKVGGIPRRGFIAD